MPLGTYTSWNLRAAQAGDPRLSLEERYPSYEVYHARLTDAARKLQADGFLLEEDVKRITEQRAGPA